MSESNVEVLSLVTEIIDQACSSVAQNTGQSTCRDPSSVLLRIETNDSLYDADDIVVLSDDKTDNKVVEFNDQTEINVEQLQEHDKMQRTESFGGTDDETVTPTKKHPHTVATYFAICGIDWNVIGSKTAAEQREEQFNAQLNQGILGLEGYTPSLSLLDLQDESLNRSPNRLRASLLDRFPQHDYANLVLDSKIFEFCFPTGISLAREPQTPQFHSFTLTSETSAMIHAGCLVIHEPLDVNKLEGVLAKPTLASVLASRKHGSTLYEHFADYLHGESLLAEDKASARLQILSQVMACSSMESSQRLKYCNKLAAHFFIDDRDDSVPGDAAVEPTSRSQLGVAAEDGSNVDGVNAIDQPDVDSVNAIDQPDVNVDDTRATDGLPDVDRAGATDGPPEIVDNTTSTTLAQSGLPTKRPSTIEYSKLLRDASLEEYCDIPALVEEYRNYTVAKNDSNSVASPVASVTVEMEASEVDVSGAFARKLIAKVFLATLRSLEPHFLKWSSIMIEASPLYVPRALIFLSKWPLYSLFDKLLRAIYAAGTSDRPSLPVSLERSIMHLLQEVPEPPPGKYRVCFQLHGNQDKFYSSSRPPLNRLTLHSLPLRTLFECLDINNMLTVFNCVLLEFRTVLVSSSLATLSEVGAALRVLLFPLTWQSPYVPILPESMLDVVYAPCPFIVGVHSSIVPQDKLMRDEVVFVNLDTNTVDLPSSDDFDTIPPILLNRVARNLKKQVYGEHIEPLPKQSSTVNSVKAAARSGHRTSLVLPNKRRSVTNTDTAWGSLVDASMNEFNNGIRETLLDFFVQLLRDYQQYMGGWEAGLDELFDRDGFVASHAESATSSNFLARLVDTQMMQMFVEDRVFAAERNFEVMLFDAHIERHFGSKSEQIHSNGSFLEDTSQDVREDHVVQPPSPTDPQEAVHLEPATCFPHQLDWSSLPPPQAVPRLITVRRGSHLVRESNSVTHVLESVYLNFYTKKRTFKARFKFAKSQAESGLREVQDLLKLFTNHAMVLRNFSKTMAKITTERRTFNYHNDPNEYMARKLWPGLMRASEQWGVVIGILGRDLENHVCGRLREVVRLLTNQLRLLIVAEAERLTEITVAKASMERAKQSKESAVSEMEECESLYRMAASTSTNMTGHSTTAVGLNSASSSSLTTENLDEVGDGSNPQFDEMTRMLSVVGDSTPNHGDSTSAPNTESNDQGSLTMSSNPPISPSSMHAKLEQVHDGLARDSSSGRVDVVGGNGESLPSNTQGSIKDRGTVTTPMLYTKPNSSISSNELAKLANRKVACSRAVESTSVVFAEEVAALARELARFTVSTSDILSEFHRDECFRIESIQRVLGHAIELHKSVVKVLMEQIQMSLGEALQHPLEDALKQPVLSENGEETFNLWVTRTRTAKNVCKSFLDFGEDRVNAFQTLSSQLTHISKTDNVGKGLQQQGNSLQRALKAMREGIYELGDGMQAPAQSSRSDLLNPIIELRKGLKTGFHTLSNKRQAHRKTLSAATSQRKKAETRLERTSEVMQSCAEELANLSSMKRNLIANSSDGQQTHSKSTKLSFRSSGTHGLGFSRAIDAMKAMTGSSSSASTYDGKQEKIAARLEASANDRAHAQDVLDTALKAEEVESDSYQEMLQQAINTFYSEEKSRVEVITARCHTLMGNELAMLSRFSSTCDTIAELVNQVDAESDLVHRVELDQRAAVFTQTALQPFNRNKENDTANSSSDIQQSLLSTGNKANGSTSTPGSVDLGAAVAALNMTDPSMNSNISKENPTSPSADSNNALSTRDIAAPVATSESRLMIIHENIQQRNEQVESSIVNTLPGSPTVMDMVDSGRPLSFVNDLWNGEGTILQRYRDVVMRLKSIQWHVSGLAEVMDKAEADLTKQANALRTADGGGYIKELLEEDSVKNGELLEEAACLSSIPIPSPFMVLLLRLHDSLQAQVGVFRRCAQGCRDLSTRARTLKRELKGIMKVHVDQKRKLDADLSRANLNVERARTKSEKLNASLATAESKLRMTSLGTQGHKQLEDRVFQLRNNVEIARRHLQECKEIVYNTLCKNNNCVSQQLARLEERQLKNLDQCRAILESFVEIENFLLLGWHESPLLLKATTVILSQRTSQESAASPSFDIVGQAIAKEMSEDGPRCKFFEGVSISKNSWPKLSKVPTQAIKGKLGVALRSGGSSTSIRSFTGPLDSMFRRNSAPVVQTLPSKLQRPISPNNSATATNVMETEDDLSDSNVADGIAMEDVAGLMDVSKLWKNVTYQHIEKKLTSSRNIVTKLLSILPELTAINTRVGIEWLEIQQGFPIMLNLHAMKGGSKGFDNADVCLSPTSNESTASVVSLSPSSIVSPMAGNQSTRPVSSRSWNLASGGEDVNQKSQRKSLKDRMFSLRKTVTSVIKDSSSIAQVKQAIIPSSGQSTSMSGAQRSQSRPMNAPLVIEIPHRSTHRDEPSNVTSPRNMNPESKGSTQAVSSLDESSGEVDLKPNKQGVETLEHQLDEQQSIPCPESVDTSDGIRKQLDISEEGGSQMDGEKVATSSDTTVPSEVAETCETNLKVSVTDTSQAGAADLLFTSTIEDWKLGKAPSPKVMSLVESVESESQLNANVDDDAYTTGDENEYRDHARTNEQVKFKGSDGGTTDEQPVQFDSPLSPTTFPILTPKRAERSTLHAAVRTVNKLWMKEARSFVKHTTGFTKTSEGMLRELLRDLNARFSEIHQTKKAIVSHRRSCELALEKAVSQLKRAEDQVGAKESAAITQGSEKRTRQLRNANRKLLEAQEALKQAEHAFAMEEKEYLLKAGYVAAMGAELEKHQVEVVFKIMERGQSLYKSMCRHLSETEHTSRQAVASIDVESDVQEFIATHRTGLSPPWASITETSELD